MVAGLSVGLDMLSDDMKPVPWAVVVGEKNPDEPNIPPDDEFVVVATLENKPVGADDTVAVLENNPVAGVDGVVLEKSPVGGDVTVGD